MIYFTKVPDIYEEAKTGLQCSAESEVLLPSVSLWKYPGFFISNELSSLRLTELINASLCILLELSIQSNLIIEEKSYYLII